MILPRITLRIDDQDLTEKVSGLTFSNSDPGGHETISGQPLADVSLRPGARIVARCGLTPVFWGNLTEPGHSQRDGRETYSFVGLGAGQYLKKTYTRQVFVDRDLSKWQPASVNRRLDRPTFAFGSAEVRHDEDGGSPSLAADCNDTWTLTSCPEVDAFYDGQGIELASVYYSFAPNANVSVADPNWEWLVSLCTNDRLGSNQNTGNIRAASGAGTLSNDLTFRRTFAAAIFRYLTGPAGTAGMKHTLNWTDLAVYGRHGLTKRGDAPQGFYPTDIAAWAVNQVDEVKIGAMAATSFILQHSVYADEVTVEQIVADMAIMLGGWHWGTWEPSSLFGTTPEFYMQPVPSAATVSVDRSDCIDIDIPKIRFDSLYDTAIVRYQDQSGMARRVTVTQDNPFVEGPAQTMVLDFGLADATTATSFANFALDIALLAARGSGSAELPLFVQSASGGMVPSCTLKAGRDRLRIRGLPDIGPLTGTSTRRYDTFHLRRVESTVDEHGIPHTRVEFDAGGDLMETLNARMSLVPILGGL